MNAPTIEHRIQELGSWFQNLDLNGVRTAPDHFLGDYPADKFSRFSHLVPEDLTGRTVLDIGCNAGFYSFEMRRRGAARVLGIDTDARYLAQARFAAEVLDVGGVEFRQMGVYDVAALGERFDLVVFMGVLYHLRHPLLALDLIHEHAARDLLVFQSMHRGAEEVEPVRTHFEQAIGSRGRIEGDEELIGDGVALMGAAKFPARVKCVLMPWKAYQAALLETRALRG